MLSNSTYRFPERNRKYHQGCPNSGCSHNCSHLTFSEFSRVYSNALRRLLTTIFAVIIFVVLPICDSKAEIPLPGMQMPMMRPAAFDRKESVLDRFRAFSGKKTLTALEGLFTRWDPVFSQNPAVVLSDGKTIARITLRLQGRAGDPPIFSISGGHCVSATMTDTGNMDPGNPAKPGKPLNFSNRGISRTDDRISAYRRPSHGHL